MTQHTDLTLTARQPFDFAASLGFLRTFPAMTGEQGTEDRALVKAVRADGVTMAATITAAESGLRVGLSADRSIGPAAAAAAGEQISFFLGLDDDLTELYRTAESDPPFATVVRRLYGYHQVKFPTPLELLCWSILCQRTPIASARAVKQALTESFGNTVTLAGRHLWAFPDLEQLLTLTQEQLAALVGNPRKADYLYRSLRGWAALDQDFLRTGPYQQVEQQLLALPGIGPWSATFLLIRGLGRMERAPIEPSLLRAAARVYARALTEAELAALAAPYGTSQGYWAHYLRAA